MAGLPRVLVVDDSRMVRVSLAKHLQAHYDIREEGDGEAAWQTLVLDHSIRAVISDLQMPKLDGYGLLEKVRASKQRRLRELPFILVSGEESEQDRLRAKTLGVSDFLTKGSGTAEILTRLDHLLALAAARQDLDAGRAQMVEDPGSGLFSRKYLDIQTAQALSLAARHHGEVSVLVLGFDHYVGLCERLGLEAAEQVGARFAKMLAAKIRREDSLGHFADGQYAIVSPGVSAALCVGFAERVREAVLAANVTMQGQRVALTVSVGVASVPADQTASAAALLDLAGSRMGQAMEAGGNRVFGGVQALAAGKRPTLTQALDLLRANRSDALLPHLAALGQEIAPLLWLLDKEFGLGLPLADIELRLSERTRGQKKSGQ